MKTRKGLIVALFIAVPLIALIALIVLLVTIAAQDPSPLQVGSTPDDVWSYVHTGGVSGSNAPNALGVVKSRRWKADGTNVHCETQFRWQTNKTFAIRKTVYHFGTNDSIQSVQSGWKFNWPF